MIMNLAEFKNEMTELNFDENSDTNRGYVSLVSYPYMHAQSSGGFADGSDGIDFVRLDEGTICYRVNTENLTGDWEIKTELNEEATFDEFVSGIIEALTLKQ